MQDRCIPANGSYSNLSESDYIWSSHLACGQYGFVAHFPIHQVKRSRKSHCRDWKSGYLFQAPARRKNSAGRFFILWASGQEKTFDDQCLWWKSFAFQLTPIQLIQVYTKLYSLVYGGVWPVGFYWFHPVFLVHWIFAIKLLSTYRCFWVTKISIS